MTQEQDTKDLFEQLGRFVADFNVLEVTVRRLTWSVLHTDRRIAEAVFALAR